MPYLILSNPTTNSCDYEVYLSNPFNTTYYKELRITGTNYGASTSNVSGYVTRAMAQSSPSQYVIGKVTNGLLAGKTYTLYAYAQAQNGTWYLAGSDTITMQAALTSKTLSLNYRNINQRYNGNINNVSFNPLGVDDPMYKWGCSRCSVACILSNIQGIEVNPRDIPTDANYNVIFSNIPNDGIISKSITYTSLASYSSSEATCLEAIKKSIDNNVPVIVRMKSVDSTHFCVAYGYKNGAATRNDILTYDTIYPKVSGTELHLTTKYGEDNNLGRVITLNFGSSSPVVAGVFTYI